jgi:hypothetical protein
MVTTTTCQATSKQLIKMNGVLTIGGGVRTLISWPFRDLIRGPLCRFGGRNRNQFSAILSCIFRPKRKT